MSVFWRYTCWQRQEIEQERFNKIGYIVGFVLVFSGIVYLLFTI